MLERQDTEELDTEEEFYRKRQQECLNRLRHYLCDHLEPERFFPYLQGKNYLDIDSCEQIRSAGTTRFRVNKMLDILIKSGPRPLEVLIRAIKRCGTTQKFIVAKLEDEYRKVCEDPKGHRGSPPPYSVHPNSHFYPGIHTNRSEPSLFIGDRIPDPSRFSIRPSTMQEIKKPLKYNRSQSHEPKPNATEVDFRNRSISDGIQNQRPGTCPSPGPIARDHDHGIVTNAMKDHNNVNDSTSPPSDVPQSIFDGNPSHFRTSDFRSQVWSEIVENQAEKQHKVSLQMPSTNDNMSISNQLIFSQEKELSKYELKTPPAPPYQNNSYKWYRSSRMPSEHDASVSCLRPSSSLSSANTECSNTSSTCLKEARNLGTPNGNSGKFNSTTHPKNLMTVPSCQNGSIQASCFTSSNFEDFSSYGSSNEKKTDVRKTPEGSPSHHTRSRSPGFRTQFPLETIPSVEPPSLDSVSEVTDSSIKIRRPPTEHEDTSVMSQSVFEDDNSSLEISSDSDVSEHQ